MKPAYNPELGRFNSVDSITGSQSLLGTFNPYAYGVNNPYLYPDPSGLSVLEDFGNSFLSTAHTVSDGVGYLGDGLNSAASNSLKYIAGSSGTCDMLYLYGMDQFCNYLTKEMLNKEIDWAQFAKFEWENRQMLGSAGTGLLCFTGIGCVVPGMILLGASSIDNYVISKQNKKNFWSLERETLIMNIVSLIPGAKLKMIPIDLKPLIDTAPIGIKQLAQFSLSIKYGGIIVVFDPLKILKKIKEKND